MDAILHELDFEKGGGLVTAIAQDDATGEILMVACMNPDSFRKTLETGEVHYWSRSRKQLWHKGQESGNVQRLKGLEARPPREAMLALGEPWRLHRSAAARFLWHFYHHPGVPE